MSLEDLLAAPRSAANPLISSTITLSGNLTRDMDNNSIPNNNEGYAFLGMAYACASLASSSINLNINSVQDAVVTAVYPRNYDGVVVVQGDNDVVEEGQEADHIDTFEVGELRRGVDHRNGKYPSYIFGRRTEDELGDYSVDNATNCPDPEAKKLIMTVVGGARDWMQWFLDFINAFQTGGLSPKNVSSYFAWNGMDGVDGAYISSHICELSGGVDKIASNANTRGLLREGKWTDYRLNFATVVGQLDKMVNEVPEKYMKVFSRRTKLAISNAKENNWSEESFRAIGTKPLAVLQAWLIASNQEIDNLWSAKRAYDELSVSEKTSLSNWFKNAMSELKVYKGGLLETYNDLPRSLKDI
jgi:hypothetical protein